MINLTSLSRVFRKVNKGGKAPSNPALAFDQPTTKRGFAHILKGQGSPMVTDSAIRSFQSNSAIGARLAGTKLW